MVDIQSPSAEIRRGKKEEGKKIEITGQKYNGLPYYIGQTIISSTFTDMYCSWSAVCVYTIAVERNDLNICNDGSISLSVGQVRRSKS